MTSDTAQLRLSLVGVIVVSLFAAMFARLWYLQVMDAEELQTLATRNQARVIYEPAPRGRILDRQGRPIVENRQTQAVTVRRLTAEDRPDVVTRLAALLAVPSEELARRIDDKRYSPYRPVPVATGVSEDIAVYLREHAADFPGVEAVRLAQRSYPHGALGAHLLGYVGEINDRELAERRGQGYRLGDEVGKSGLEAAYEADLRGEPGVTRLEVDSSGRILRTLESRLPVQGKDVQLTIDLDVQRLAEESLAQGLGYASRRLPRPAPIPGLPPGVPPPPVRPAAGSVVVLDPRDGAVLAMASNPTFEPGLFVNGIRPDVFGSLQDPVNNFPLTNRSIQGQYAPGSTFKLVTALAGLRKGIITPSTLFEDEGSYRLRNCRGTKCVFRNAGGMRHGKVNLARAIAVSSDAFFYSLGAEFWFQRNRFGDPIQEAAHQLGLGKPTGLGLPHEKRGRVPDPETRKRLNAQNPKAFPNGRWFAGDNVNLAIGQGEMALTPLQLANAYATFANGGTIFRPRVVAGVLEPGGPPMRQEAPVATGRADLPPELRAPILDGLQGTVADPKGTAANAFSSFPLPAFPVAAKTGTAEVRGARDDTALFAAFAPALNPQYALAVVMEESGFGGSAAAPVARRIFEQLAGTPPGPVRFATSFD